MKEKSVPIYNLGSTGTLVLLLLVLLNIITFINTVRYDSKIELEKSKIEEYAEEVEKVTQSYQEGLYKVTLYLDESLGLKTYIAEEDAYKPLYIMYLSQESLDEFNTKFNKDSIIRLDGVVYNTSYVKKFTVEEPHIYIEDVKIKEKEYKNSLEYLETSRFKEQLINFGMTIIILIYMLGHMWLNYNDRAHIV